MIIIITGLTLAFGDTSGWAHASSSRSCFAVDRLRRASFF
jgi:hypothetical protein